MKNHSFKIPYLIGGILIALGVVVLVILQLNGKLFSSRKSISSFEECAAAGYPIMESYPRQCRADDKLFVESLGAAGQPAKSGGCAPAGCSGQLCVDADKASDIITTCEFRQEYACYKNAVCERQPSGQCGWTPSAELNLCISNAQNSSASPQ